MASGRAFEKRDGDIELPPSMQSALPAAAGQLLSASRLLKALHFT